MRIGKQVVVAAACWFLCVLPSDAQPASEPGVFVLQHASGGVRLERVEVPAGQTVVLQAGPGSGVIGAIFPPGPGRSGSLEQVREGRMIVLQNLGDRVRCEVRIHGQPASSFPTRAWTDLQSYDSRVNLVGGDGTRVAFLLTEYRNVTVDPGPVQNLFAGQPIPLGPNDWVVTTETYSAVASEPLGGHAEIDVDGHAFVRAVSSDGRSGWFVLDTGAAETVVARSFLADTARIAGAAMLEYAPPSGGNASGSAAATPRVLEYSPQGATGAVKGVMGHARFPELRIGDLRFRDAEVAVLPSLPDVFGRAVAGILGLDLLRRGGRVAFEYPSSGTGRGHLRLGAALDSGSADVRVPFSMISSHIVIPARLNGTDVSLILDSGCPGALVDSTGAARCRLTIRPERALQGLDGNLTRSGSALASIQVGGARLESVRCRVSALPVFATLRDDRPMGLFGNELIARFERVLLDFPRRAVFLSPRRGS